MKYTVVRTDTADEQIRKIILYINENFGSETALQKLDELEESILLLGDNPDIGTGARRPLVQRIRQHLVNRIQRLEKTKQKCDNSHCQSSQPDRQIPFHFIPPSSSSKER